MQVKKLSRKNNKEASDPTQRCIFRQAIKDKNLELLVQLYSEDKRLAVMVPEGYLFTRLLAGTKYAKIIKDVTRLWETDANSECSESEYRHLSVLYLAQGNVKKALGAMKKAAQAARRTAAEFRQHSPEAMKYVTENYAKDTWYTPEVFAGEADAYAGVYEADIRRYRLLQKTNPEKLKADISAKVDYNDWFYRDLLDKDNVTSSNKPTILSKIKRKLKRIGDAMGRHN